jgi:hypothetical protein
MVDYVTDGSGQKPATAARIYDYLLGGIHNFPADREAAAKIVAQVPDIPVFAQANRAFVRRAASFLVDSGVRQFLDVGSGIPTQGNVHEIVQQIAPDSRVVYVDIDPVAVAESLEILDSNPRATAIRADLRQPRTILDHPAVHEMLDLGQPIAVLLAAVLHFIPDGGLAYRVVEDLTADLVPGSFLLVSHGTGDGYPGREDTKKAIGQVYEQRTATPSTERTHAQVRRFFTGLTMVDPGLVWTAAWRPDASMADPTGGNPSRGMAWAGVGRKE